ncbi:MAG: DnaA regulatory inactivator Hda [Luteimonas sp.]
MSGDSQAGARQLPLGLRFPPDQRLETFVDAPAGATEQLRALPASEAAVYLQGVAGAGKTHLALASCAAAHALGAQAGYLPLRAMRGRLREALTSLEGQRLVALDDVDAIAGEREDEVALFDFHNRARAAGVALLYTATQAPDAVALTLPDLRSRLAQCARIVLAPLDDDGRRRVLQERARRRGLAMDEAAYDWLLARVGRDLAGLTRLLDQIDRASLAAKRRITVPFLRDLVGRC